jgi:site-specific DNA-methyltransferase (adenine-specific)
MEFMKDLPDNAYDLAIVDPPYGIKVGGSKSFGKVGGSKSFGKVGGSNIVEPKTYKTFDDSAIPSKEYFTELMRISTNQIIFGGNYFIEHLRNTSCFIVWDKDNTGNFADCELAWTSFGTAVRKFKFRWNGLLQENMKHKEHRIHPTQKPVALYKWLLTNYAKPGQTIFDSHVGSGSIRIACHDLGFDFEGCEIDADYHASQEKRYQQHIAQSELFESGEIQSLVYDKRTKNNTPIKSSQAEEAL